MIYVTVGVSRGFRRLVEGADEIAANHPERVVVQTGDTGYEPTHADAVDVLPQDEHERYFREATCVVGHAGTGTILTAAETDVRLVVFPRDPRTDEVFDDHQLEHVRGWCERLDLTVVRTVEDLATVLSTPRDVPRVGAELSNPLSDEIGTIVREEAERE